MSLGLIAAIGAVAIGAALGVVAAYEAVDDALRARLDSTKGDRMTDNESTRALMAQIDSLVIQRDAAEAMARDAERRESDLGLQVVAQAARLRLATQTIGACRFVIDDSRVRVEGVTAALVALAAWDAVPGDKG